MAFKAEKLPHESAEVGTRRVLAFVFGFVAFVAALIASLGAFYQSQVRSGSLEMRLGNFPAPQLQPNPGQDYVNFMKSQRSQMAGIEHAMATVTARGKAAYDPLDGIGPLKSVATPQDGASRATPRASVAPYGTRP